MRPRPLLLLLLLLATASLLAGCGRKPDALADCRLPAGATLLAIGDSLTRGHGAEGQGYAEQLQALLAAGRPGTAVVNLGIDGERSEGLAGRIDAALAEHKPAVVLVTSGGNDFLRRVAEAETRRHLRTVVDRVRASGAHALVFGVPPPGLAAAVGVASDHSLFADLAQEGKAHVLRGVVAGVLAREALKADPIHPNREGYAVMAKAAFEALGRCR